MTKRILVVEDNQKNRVLLRDLLMYHGYEVIEAENGEEGIQKARENHPDLILMDLQLPVVDGFAAAKVLKDTPETADIKIIAVTSFAMKGDREKVIESKFDDYLSKPIDTRQLPRVVKSLLGDDQ
ncbi:MAG: response regulator [Alphaproteobacteria bacterium]|uniref:Response regulator n=1 Tax=Candidatus Nitrobium versatile TaxID=2884831 RepID=A0A953JG68_9BACT|nr:response regulator [Candidatus Nitrobium versatile]